MRLQITKSTNAECFYVVKSVYENKKRTNVVVEKLGNLNDVKLRAGDQDPYEWARSYVEELNRIERVGLERTVTAEYNPNKTLESDKRTLFDGGYFFLQRIYHELGLNKICRRISEKYKFEYDLDNILSRLVYGRILYPTSKLGTMEYSKRLIEQPRFELHQIYRALEVLAEECDLIQSELYKNSLRLSKRNDKILYYDCTNYFFEIEEEDELRKYGNSKEHRPSPIVQMGLFLDGDGIPLAFSITPGNTNEQVTLKPLEKKIIKDFSNSSFVVCTDAGLSSTVNRKFNDIAGRAFITTQSIKKMREYLKDWALAKDGWSLPGHKGEYDLNSVLTDEVLFERYKNKTFLKERWINEDGLEQRIIVTFSIKYMLYQREIRNRQLARVQKMIESPASVSRVRATDPKRFVKEVRVANDGDLAEKKSYILDEDRYLDECKYDGFYAVATNLEDDAESIVRINSGRWEIEESFRIMKSEFSARPVFLSRADRIAAHFLTCFLALTVYRYLEKKIGGRYSCIGILNTLKSMQFAYLRGKGYIPVYTKTEITDKLHNVFGFRTDSEIVTSKMMKKILHGTQS